MTSIYSSTSTETEVVPHFTAYKTTGIPPIKNPLNIPSQNVFVKEVYHVVKILHK